MISIRFSQYGAIDNSHPALVVIPARIVSEDEESIAVGNLSKEFRVYVFAGLLPAVDTVVDFVKELGVALIEQQIKRCTLFSIGRSTGVGQALAAMYPKMVRRLVLLDAMTRLAPDLFTRIIDRLERFLPLGLPLKQLSKSFDSRPLLHRIYCPSLVLLSASASDYIKQESQFIANKIPNAWLRTLEQDAIHESKLSEELQGLIQAFMQVPTKRPQR